MDYIKRLDNFDAPDIANIAVGSELYEEAFSIYVKYNQHGDAITVLLNHIQDIPRAQVFAEKIDTSEVWSKLGKAQLDESSVADAIGSLSLTRFVHESSRLYQFCRSYRCFEQKQ